MNWIIENPISIALGWTLLHFLWQGCAIAILTKLVLEVFKKSSSNTRYAIACAGFLAMAILPCITFSSNWQRTSQVAASNAAEPGLEVPPNSQFTTPSAPVEPKVDADAQLATDSPKVPATDARGQAASDWFRPQTLASLRLRLQPFLPWLVVGWFAGVGLLSLRLVLSWRQLRQMQTTGLHKVTDYQQRVCAELCKALRVRQAVKIAHSALVEVPTLVGWLQPIVLLPMSTMSGLEQSQLRALLAHELAHVRRADFAVNLLQTVIETLLFYHPAVWWLSARIRQERENCCDDLAVAECRDGRSYVEALLRMEELRNTALAMSARGGSLMQRASRLLEPGNAHRKTGVQPPVGAALFSLLLLALVAAVSTSILPGSTANAEAPQAPAGSEENFEAEWTDGEIMPEMPATSSVGQDAESMGAQDLIEEMLKARSSISSCRISAQLTHPAEGSRRGYEKIVRDFDVSVDGKSGYCKSLLDWHTKSKPSGRVDRTLINASGILSDPGSYAPSASFSTDPESPNSKSLRRPIFNLRLLGLTVRSPTTVDNASVRKEVRRLVPADLDGQVRPSSLDGVECARVTFKLSKGRSVEYWIASEFGFNPVQIVLNGSKGRQWQTKCNYQKHPMESGGVVWFPSQIDYFKKIDEKIYVHDRLVVQKVAFPESIPENEFDVATLGLTKGRMILDQSARQMVWTGKEIRAVTGADYFDPKEEVFLLGEE